MKYTDIVGVIGAGVMGRGVAQSLAQAGHKVFLVDLSKDILEQARKDIRTNYRLQTLFSQGDEIEDITTILERIIFTTDYAPLADAHFIIENVTEKWEIKQKVYKRLEEICSENCIFAVNTSAISITRVGSLTARADKVIGAHFMNPVPMKPMVEVIRGQHTSEETIERTEALLTTMNKNSIVVNDMPGFVTNRVLMLTINEAIFLLHEQVSTPEDIDALFKFCFGHKMGPLETADLIGLDTILYSLDVLYESFNDSKYRPCPLLKKMVYAGLHGKKSGRGFYTYVE